MRAVSDSGNRIQDRGYRYRACHPAYGRRPGEALIVGGPGSRAAYPRPMSRRRSTARAAAPLAVPVALGVTLGVILAVTSGAAPAHVSRGNAGIPSTSAAPAASVAPHAHDPSVVTSVIPGEAGHHGAPGEAGHDTVPGAPGAGPGR